MEIMLNTDDPDELLRVIFNYQDHKLVRVLELTNMRVVHKKHMISAAMRMEFDPYLRKIEINTFEMMFARRKQPGDNQQFGKQGIKITWKEEAMLYMVVAGDEISEQYLMQFIHYLTQLADTSRIDISSLSANCVKIVYKLHQYCSLISSPATTM